MSKVKFKKNTKSQFSISLNEMTLGELISLGNALLMNACVAGSVLSDEMFCTVKDAVHDLDPQNEALKCWETTRDDLVNKYR